ncbi:MAG: glyoxylase-like metal-dependent hydrolase (beta-lactamase superfamily II) [Polyangiales bacterium]|jgi:glyoxylase-like metal-dependent hydrolase (beta-lactamase superfamily II)/uncharacterized protein (DUF302 family)/rhodanese-related sulfurtransferase
MIFEELNQTACKTYLIADEETKEAMLVDPVLEGNEHYLREIAQRGLLLRYVIDTHVHADHISGAASLRDETGADYVMHESSASACANHRVHEGETLLLGDLKIKFLHTPGHTPDSLSLLFPDRLLTGDFLFIGEGGAGRTDLPGGDAGAHWDALQKLRKLPNALLVFPAHDYHGRHHSTLGEERLHNPRLQERSRQGYITWLQALRQEPAEWMTDVVHANYACAQDPRAAWIPVDDAACEVKGTGNVNAELVRNVSAETLNREIRAGSPVVLVDVRQPIEFDATRISGSRLIPVGELAKRLDELAGLENTPIVTVCSTGGRSATAAAVLTLAGFKQVRTLEGGVRRWNQLGFACSPAGRLGGGLACRRGGPVSEGTYGFAKTLKGVTVGEIVRDVEVALKQQGFGVLTTIDIQATFKKKLDHDFRPYVILGACNPRLAEQALSHDAQLGLLLPCNIVVQQTSEVEVEVSIADPAALFRIANDPTLEPIASDAARRLRRVLEAL